VRAGCPNLIERLEGGLLSYGNDMTRENNPFECGLDRYCALDKPIDFIARKALEKIQEEGVKRRIMGIRIGGDPVPGCVEPWPISAKGKTVGAVSSAAFSPDLAGNIGFAMLDRDFWEPGQKVEVAAPDGTRQAMVAELPFVTK
jgi:dimethylsulfoniopropionate demethylase